MTSDFTEKNRRIKQARTYKSEFAKAVEILVNVVQEQRTWVSDAWFDTKAGEGKEIRMLEYACGPGHISLALAPFVSRVIGMDISDGMIDEFNKNAREADRSDTVVAFKADLLAEPTPAEVSGPEYFNFDLVVVSMALHHFEHPEQALKRLAERVKKGGVMMIIDLVPEGMDHQGLRRQMGEVVDTISKHGFDREETRKMYEDAGTGTEFKYQVIEEPLVFTKGGKTFHKTVFMARGQKAEDR
ncbi:S-adenosyl-L-methionine-dependent methyltransferase [Aspergillus cavernicola]|uniref:S-adenosyl-L-methionine-dependent methyltransferase n=1 Tax=Aspergillus cavernicola TaxID=176166 RepID=A0ABR4IMF4_9EURO